MSTPLSRSLERAAAAPAPTSGESRFERAYAGKQRRVAVTIPILNEQAWLRYVGAGEEIEMHAAVVKYMSGIDLEDRGMSSPTGVFNEGAWERAEIIHLLERAVVAEDKDDAERYGTIADWGRLPLTSLYHLTRAYQDMVAELDPELESISQDEIDELWAAAEKKRGILLRRSGVAKLAAFILSLGARPSSSPPPSSSAGESSPA